jgi:cellulose synthase/poly-beta-1,6-N-acetylglucosamine synthase-like glycosyltransferase
MNLYNLFFWIIVVLIFYTYIGYGLFLLIIVSFKNKISIKKNHLNTEYLPEVTIVVAAYNEEDCINDKIINTLELDYPKNKILYLFVTSGSTDKTKNIIQKHKEITLLHTDKREGKIEAINQAMKFVKSEIVIFSDANAMINKMGVKEIIKHYKNKKIGGVAGEKRILKTKHNKAAGSGEGIYWKYESFLKKYDFKLYSTVGAAGELFSIRTKLYQNVEKNILLDDFIISMRIAKQGYIIAYEPNAYAQESGSESIKEEMKRKIRISAGGIQSIIILSELLNIFKYGILSFQYISHRVLRWSITPIALLILFPLNLVLFNQSSQPIYTIILICQITFYFLAILGWIFENINIKLKLLYIPYYFTFMNFCLIIGFFNFLKGSQTVLWEKAKRA